MKLKYTSALVSTVFALSASFVAAHAAEKFPATLEAHLILAGDTKIQVPDDAPKDLHVNGKFHEKHRIEELGAIEGKSNGRPTGVNFPFKGQAIQGHSGIVNNGDGTFWLLTDNGLGSKLNSSDSALYFNLYKIDFEEGQWEHLETVFIKDANKKVPFRITHEDTESRYLTGADFDPESLQVVGDNFWVGEEFGPFLLKLDRQGQVVEVFETEVDGKVVKSPDYPGMNLPGSPDAKLPEFQVRRSKGFEGMALSADGKTLYPLLEGVLWDSEKKAFEEVDGKPVLRLLEFSLSDEKYTGKSWFYPLEDAKHSIGDFNMIDARYGLIIERDDTEGTADKACKEGDDQTRCFDNVANFKRVYKIELNPDEQMIRKVGYIDLMAIEDPNQKSQVDLIDGKFQFPFFTIENVDVVGERYIVVGNDNNYPKSTSRKPNVADDNELILLDVKDLLEAK